jgi:RNA polymerase sigma-32 factor
MPPRQKPYARPAATAAPVLATRLSGVRLPPRRSETPAPEPDAGAEPAAAGAEAAAPPAAATVEPPEAPEILAALATDQPDDGDDEIELPPPVIDVLEAGAVRSDSTLVGFGSHASPLAAYLQELRLYPLLDRDEEHLLAVHYQRTGETLAARRLITANLRLVVKIAQEYRRAHRNLLDLIQEGNIGLIQAVQKYDPYRGVKLSSYAAWWIRAYILKFILANWRIVKIGTTQAQRKLFFNLRKERDKLERMGFEVEPRHLAAALDVSEKDVIEMERRLGSSETSLDSPVRSDESGGRTQGDFVPAAPAARPDVQVEAGEFQELLRKKLHDFGTTLIDRELDIFRERMLNDTPATLQEIGERYGVSRERARQIEERLKKKLRHYLEKELGDSVAFHETGE